MWEAGLDVGLESEGMSQALITRVVVAVAAIVAAAAAIRRNLSPLVVIALIVSLPALLISFGMADVLDAWRQARTMAGWRRTLRLGWLMTRVRHRAPFRALKIYAPAITSALPLLLGVSVIAASWTAPASARDMSIGAVSVLLGVVSFFVLAAPPAVLFLGASQYGGFSLMKRVHVEARCYVMSLVNQASESVLHQYHSHYAGVRANMPAAARAVSSAVAPMVDPTAPRFESIRTRTGLWQRTVLDMIDGVPIVLIDARGTGRQVQQEALWMLDPDRCDRALFVCEDDGRAPLFECLHDLGVVAAPGTARILAEDDACALVGSVASGRQPLPGLTPLVDGQASRHRLARAEAEWRAKGQALEAVRVRIRRGSVPDRELDAEIWRVCGAVQVEAAGVRPTADAGPPPAASAPGLTARVDAATAFAHEVLEAGPGRRLYDIDMATDGSGAVSLTIRDEHGNLIVFETRASERLSPPRAVLDVLVQSLLA